MTHFLAINDPGRAGGSWLIHICNSHPVDMRILGEAHYPLQLGFRYPCSPQEYDGRIIAFFEAQRDQGVHAAGIVKSFWKDVQQFIFDNGGLICTVLRNPMEVVGFRRRVPRHDIDAPQGTRMFKAHVLHYKKVYEVMLALAKHADQPIIRLEDLNRSLGGDGQFFRSFMEWLTRAEFSQGYIKHIQRHYLPGYHYGCRTIKEGGVVVGMGSAPFVSQAWRMEWGDDPRPGEMWQEWSKREQRIFAEHLGPVCDRLGYDYQDGPGTTRVGWEFAASYEWGKLVDTLHAIPCALLVPDRSPLKGAPWMGETDIPPCSLPEWKGGVNALD